MAEVVGGAIGLALIGALFALILRRLANLNLLQSYVAGVAIATLVAAWGYSYNTGVPYGGALVIYGLAAPIALALLWLTGRPKKA